MNILIIGDVVGSVGCSFLSDHLTKLKKENNVDFVIANGENSADGNGISQKSAESIFSSGVDVITTGNHAFRQPDYKILFEDIEGIIRPANFAEAIPGQGYYIFNFNDIRYSVKICIINLIGVVYMSNASNPFECVEKIISTVEADIFIIDFHAEATAEKLCMAYYLDSKYSNIAAIVGTHTHVQTADEQLLPTNGTAYITDIGMVGPINSVLGVEIDRAVQKMRTGLPVKFINATGPCKLCGVLVSLDSVNFRPVSINRINIIDK